MNGKSNLESEAKALLKKKTDCFNMSYDNFTQYCSSVFLFDNQHFCDKWERGHAVYRKSAEYRNADRL
jgi:hypothetical protein